MANHFEEFKRLGFCDSCDQWPTYVKDMEDPQANHSVECWEDDGKLAMQACRRAMQIAVGQAPADPVPTTCPFALGICAPDLQMASDRL